MLIEIWRVPIIDGSEGIYYAAMVTGIDLLQMFVVNKPPCFPCHRMSLIVSAFCVIVLLTVIFGIIAFASSLINTPISEQNCGSFACAVESDSCTRCDEISNRYPEWTDEDVELVLRSQAKASSYMAGIFPLYTSGLFKLGVQLLANQ